MEELLRRLERRIQELIHQHDQLKQSSKQYQQGQDVLLARQVKAISQIETLVARLKAIEKLS